MQKNSLRSQIVRNLGFDLTKSQEVAADLLADFFASKNYSQTFVLKGYAGTGKTTLISSCVRSLVVSKVKVVLLAPTGRAAKVLSAYSGYPAYTIHRWIYRKQSEKDGFGKFVLNRNTLKNAVIIVDEASMINNNSFDDSAFGSGRLLDDLVQYVTSGHECKLMLAGDVAQLPPVRLDVSPALDKRVLESMGLDVSEITLGEVVRQAQDSGILYNATRIRNILESGNVEIPKFSLTGYNDIARISGADIIESIESSYSRAGTQDAVVINYSNKRANKYNQGIRSRILWREEELSSGDFLMVVKNSYFWVEDIPEIGFIANGDIVEVIRLYKVREMYGFRFADVLVRLVDYQQQELNVTIILDTLDIEGPSLSVEKSKELYANIAEEYAQIKSKKAKFKAISQDIHFNALQVKFAYAVTCHKAQGGQWKEVYIDQGFFKEDMISREYLRWLYTALTRATDKVYFVNFNPLFFE
ncbi:MAG TPA: AAA family ATPase [Tenuifilaceae bacterium]|nr:AAA family ATPase [Tenuifilaceae bacterium]